MNSSKTKKTSIKCKNYKKKIRKSLKKVKKFINRKYGRKKKNKSNKNKNKKYDNKNNKCDNKYGKIHDDSDDSDDNEDEFNFIFNPETGKKVSIHSKIGKAVLNNYINFLKNAGGLRNSKSNKKRSFKKINNFI